jgi:hypothetical protein
MNKKEVNDAIERTHRLTGMPKRSCAGELSAARSRSTHWGRQSEPISSGNADRSHHFVLFHDQASQLAAVTHAGELAQDHAVFRRTFAGSI